MISSFKGGIHPEDSKHFTSGKPIEVMPVPSRLYVPVSMHWGKPCDPVVKKGDTVTVGQVIADSTEPIPVPIHSPVSGTVADIVPHDYVGGGTVMSIVIDNDGQDTFGTDLTPHPDWKSLSPAELIALIRRSGVVGMGGAAFPTHLKLKSVLGLCDTLIIDGAECEPYITCDHRLMLEHPEELIGGVEIIRTLLGLPKAYIGVETNKPDCIANLNKYLAENSVDTVEVRTLRTKYPQGYEKQLIKAVTGREVKPGGLPSDVGCAVMNAQTAAAVYRGIVLGIPLTKRTLTISGPCIANPKNVEVRFGTTLQEVIDWVGGFRSTPGSVLIGGPMMGLPQYSLDACVIKSTNGIIALQPGANGRQPEHPACIRCGRCASVCPMHLEPVYINAFAEKGRWSDCEKYHVRDCMECGSCAFICPARIPLVQTFRMVKAKLGPPKRPAPKPAPKPDEQNKKEDAKK